MKKLKTEIRKEQLIHGVLKVIARNGLKKLSVASVSKEVGLVPSALYRHFRSKDQMLNAVLDYIEGRIENNFREICEQTNDPVERLHMFLTRQLKLIKESPAIPTVVFSQGFFSEDPVRRGKVHQIFGQFKNRMTATLKWGQKNGSIRRDIKAETILPFWVGIIQTGALFYHLSAGEYDLESHGKRTWKIFQQIIDPTPNVKKK